MKKTIKIISACAVSSDGIQNQWVMGGEEIELPEMVANGLIRDGLAVDGEADSQGDPEFHTPKSDKTNYGKPGKR